MKTWMIALAMVAVLSMTGFAEAKGKGGGKHKGKGHGLHGKIDSVGNGSLTLAVGGKKHPHSVTVKYDAGTKVSVNGAAGGTITNSLVGQTASIVGSQSGDTITATSITVGKHGKHHKKKAA